MTSPISVMLSLKRQVRFFFLRFFLAFFRIEYFPVAKKWPVVLASNLRKVRKDAEAYAAGYALEGKEAEKQPANLSLQV